MGAQKILSIFFLVNAVYAGTMQQTVQDVFSHTTTGVPDKGIKPLDPVVLEHIHVAEEPLEMKSHFSNLKVTGFKDVKMSDYHEEGDQVKFTLKFDFIAEGPVRLEFLKKDKSLNGNIKYEGGATGHITYHYTTKKEHGKDVYELGPEEISCESQHAKSTLSDDLRTAVAKDPDAKAKESDYEKIRSEHQAKVVCEIATAVFRKAIENIRVAGHHGGL